MQIFHDAYFEGKIDFKGDVLEILEQRQDWAKFMFTQGLFRYVFMDFIPELIVHSKNQDEEQVRNHYDFYSWFHVIYTSSVVLSPDTFESLETLQDNKLAIVCNKLDLKPMDRFPPTRSVSCAAITVKTRHHVALIASVMSKSDPQSAHCARTPRMTLTWDTGGRVMKWALLVLHNIRQLNCWPEYPTASLLLSIAMNFMLTSLDNVQTTQTDSNTAKTMALDHLGLREVESMRVIAWAHQNRNLADFEKAPRDYKDKLSSELTIRSHLTTLYNTLLKSPSLRPTLLSPLSAL
ncbi:hypothetical protein B0H14DRAFT_3438047 [Mycena olivaceomarginata]|nr:hypothetical protein B0H14DRAFT_3438047 [Mycena olivaceomarginata]